MLPLADWIATFLSTDNHDDDNDDDDNDNDNDDGVNDVNVANDVNDVNNFNVANAKCRIGQKFPAHPSSKIFKLS